MQSVGQSLVRVQADSPDVHHHETSVEEASGWTVGFSSLPVLKMVFEPQEWLSPALLKNGRSVVNRLNLDPDRALPNTDLAISCDTGHGISEYRRKIDLGRGPQPVESVIDDPRFPVLYELIESAETRRWVNFTVTCKWEGKVLAELTKSVLWLGRSEWLDQKDTWRFVQAFINPYEEGVLEVLDKSVDILHNLADPGSNFDAYQTKNSDFVIKQVQAVFHCLRDQFQINYISPPPVSVYLPGAVKPTGQRIRSPKEVIDRKRGTCHDIAVLMASCIEHIGIYPLVCLVCGHTFLGLWLDENDHREFWDKAEKNAIRMPQELGREWTITNIEKIRELEREDKLWFLDATYVTKRMGKFEEAVKEGQGYLKEGSLKLRPFDVAIDIRASRRLVQPL